MRGYPIDGRLRLVPKEDLEPPAPSFVYTPPPLAGLRWNPRRARFSRRKRFALLAIASLATWAVVYATARVLL